MTLTFHDIIDIIQRNGETPEHLWMLGCWLIQYGNEFWNGECYNTEKEFDGRNLYPVYEFHAEYCASCIVGYELR